MSATAQSSPAPRSIMDALRSCALPMGCPVGFLESPRTTRIERADGDDQRVLTFARGSVGLVSLPPDDALESDLDDAAIEALIEATRTDLPVGTVRHVGGTTFIVDDEPVLALADRHTLRTPKAAIGALVLDPRPAILDDLRAEVEPIDWREGGGDLPSAKRVGVLAGGLLVALATVEEPVGRLARVRVVVSPTFRRRGFGRMVVSALAKRVLSEGLLPYGRLAVGNIGAHAVAAAVGFVVFARALTMRVVARRDYSAVTSTSP